MDRRVTPPKRVTSPIWGPPPPCKQALRLTHEPCLDITIVSLYCFGSPRRKFSNYSESEQRSGHITEIANYSYPRLNYS